MPACIIPISFGMLLLRFFVVLLTCWMQFAFENALQNSKHINTQSQWNGNKCRRKQQKKNENKKVLKLSQSAVGIWKQWRYKRCRPYQMNPNRKTKEKKCVMHTENQNVCVIGKREHINWHEMAIYAWLQCCDGQTCTNLRQTKYNRH